MTRNKKQLPEYLSFTRKERRGIVVLIVLILGFSILPFFFPFFSKKKIEDHSAFEKEIAALRMKQTDSSGYPNRNYDDDQGAPYNQPGGKNYYSRQPTGELFYFDPNTLDAAGWQRLGVREKTANTIRNYIAKGGRFYKPEDIGKIWGLQADMVTRLLPYVRIAPKPGVEHNKNISTGDYKNYEKKQAGVGIVDVNDADTSAFIALPGIGSKLAKRIVAFREKLGGFYKVEQVGETFGLADSVFQKIKNKLVLGNPQVKKININKASVDELKQHPYLRYNLANAIVQYRTAHGDFGSLSDLKKIMIITEEMYIKAAPYLTIK